MLGLAQALLKDAHRYVRTDHDSTRTTGGEDDTQMNGICFRGAEHTFNDSSQRWEERQQNTGHWGPSVYNGCAAVRQGHYAHLKAPGAGVC